MTPNTNNQRHTLIVLFTLGVLLFSIACWDIFSGLVFDWGDNPNASHGYLIPVVVAYLVHQQWEHYDFKCTKIKTVCGLFGIGSIFIFLYDLNEIVILSRVGAFIIFYAFLLLFLGDTFFKKNRFALFYILFAIPVPVTLYDFLASPLKKLAAVATHKILTLLSIPVLRDGAIIELPNATLEVVNACSGLNALISIMALSSLAGYIMFRSNKLAFIFLCLGIPIAISANTIRITLLAMVTYYFGEEATQGFMHYFLGAISVNLYSLLFIFLAVILVKQLILVTSVKN